MIQYQMRLENGNGSLYLVFTSRENTSHEEQSTAAFLCTQAERPESAELRDDVTLPSIGH